MTIRVRPKRFGTNQNYIQRNKPRSAHTNAPLVGNDKTLIVFDDETGTEVEALTDNGIPLTADGVILTNG